MEGQDYPIARPLSWYALVHGRNAYGNQLLPLGTVRNFLEFAQYVKHIPSPSEIFDGAHAWRIAHQHWGYGMCVFEEGVRPEWEDPQNQHGVDLVFRAQFHPEALTAAWENLLLMLVNGLVEDVTGVRLLFKQDRRGHTHKLEVWCRSKDCSGKVSDALEDALQIKFEVFPRRERNDARNETHDRRARR